jgi:hypothetical protein
MLEKVLKTQIGIDMKILIKLMRLLYLKKVIKQHLGLRYKNGNNLKIKQKQMNGLIIPFIILIYPKLVGGILKLCLNLVL